MAFTQQELEAAYTQMQEERQAETNWANKATKKLQGFLKKSHISFRNSGNDFYRRNLNFLPSPIPEKYELYFRLCQYDHWHIYIQKLQNIGVQMKPWNGHYTPAPHGKWDLSNDPDFADAPQKTFKVTIEYEDSHASGY